MFGKNKILPPKKSDGKKLDVHSIFATFQGEGIYTGFPAVFIRLSGCNLTCSFCDTEFESFAEMSITEIINEAKKLGSNKEKLTHNLAVITGGEPLRQNIIPLCEELIKNRFKIQIETNGTLFLDLPKEVDIICSPKNNTPGGYHKIRPDLLSRISAFKFLISAHNKNYKNIAEVGQSEFNIPVYLQPIDEYDEWKNKANHELTLELARKHGHRISLQTHKIWKIE